MDIYDLDKTQEWLNRTMRIDRQPAIRGGVRPDRRARRDVLLSLGVTLGVLLLLTLVHPHSRTSGPILPAAAVVAAPSETPSVKEAASGDAWRMAAVSPTITTTRIPNSLRRLSSDPSVAAIQLSGSIRPLPGHVAPPAPIWLDGVIARRH